LVKVLIRVINPNYKGYFELDHLQISTTNVQSCINTDGSTAEGIAQCQADPASCGILALSLSNEPSNASEVNTSPLETDNNYVSYFMLEVSQSFPIDVSFD